MTDEFDLDPMESELRRRFDTIGTPPDDPDAVLGSMRPRLRRARRNHRIATSAAATLVVVAAVVVGLAAVRGGDAGNVRITPAASRPPSDSTTPTAPPTQGPGATPTTAPTADPAPAATAPAGGTVPEPTGTGATGTPSDAGGAGSGSSGGAPTSLPGPEPTAAAPTTDTPYASSGGSVVVHRSGSTISLASSTPAAGFTQEVHDNGPTRVEVRFQNGQTEWRIRVDLVNGELEEETTPH